MTSTVVTDASKMIGDRKAGTSGIVERRKNRASNINVERSLESCRVRNDLVRVWIFIDKFSDECVGACDHALLYDKLMFMSVSCAKYFCVSNFVKVMVHAAITKKIKLKII